MHAFGVKFFYIKSYFRCNDINHFPLRTHSSYSRNTGGRGAIISIEIELNKDALIYVLVGMRAPGTCYWACGSGGGTFIMTGSSYNNAEPLLVILILQS